MDATEFEFGDVRRKAREIKKQYENLAPSTVPLEKVVRKMQQLCFTPEIISTLTGLEANNVEHLFSLASDKGIRVDESIQEVKQETQARDFNLLYAQVSAKFPEESTRFAVLCHQMTATSMFSWELDVWVQFLLDILFSNSFTTDIISIYAGLPLADVETFLLNPLELPVEKRFKLGMVAQNLVTRLSDYILHSSGLVKVSLKKIGEYGEME